MRIAKKRIIKKRKGKFIALMLALTPWAITASMHAEGEKLLMFSWVTIYIMNVIYTLLIIKLYNTWAGTQ